MLILRKLLYVLERKNYIFINLDNINNCIIDGDGDFCC